MKLNDIRSRVGDVPNTQQNTKAATRLWLTTFANTHPLALTLTLKQSIRVKTPCGTYYRRITRADVERIARQFQQKLNRVVFGKHQADRYGKSLNISRFWKANAAANTCICTSPSAICRLSLSLTSLIPLSAKPNSMSRT
jgi:hypothetical protein